VQMLDEIKNSDSYTLRAPAFPSVSTIWLCRREGRAGQGAEKEVVDVESQ